MRLLLTLTMANSAATKKPFKKTSTKINSMLHNMGNGSLLNDSLSAVRA